MHALVEHTHSMARPLVGAGGCRRVRAHLPAVAVAVTFVALFLAKSANGKCYVEGDTLEKCGILLPLGAMEDLEKACASVHKGDNWRKKLSATSNCASPGENSFHGGACGAAAARG